MSGADVAVLDDAFQHRRIARDADIVLVSADDWSGRPRSLPVGPYREHANALRRASLVVITRKAANDDAVRSVDMQIKRYTPGVPIAVVRLVPDEVMREARPLERIPVSMLAGKRIVAIAAIGNPRAFFDQLSGLGAIVTPRSFPDHHAFSREDIDAAIQTDDPVDYIVCTLKDAVKLAPLWPAGAKPLWYVSLAVRVERGDSVIDALLMRL